MYRIRKSFTFEAAHQLSSAYSHACTDCIHGHSYTVEVFLVSEKLNKDGMVLDFGLLSSIMSSIYAKYDHALILPSPLFEQYKATTLTLDKLVRWDSNPTAERMAVVFFDDINFNLSQLTPEARGGCILEKVRVHETAKGWAEFIG